MVPKLILLSRKPSRRRRIILRRLFLRLRSALLEIAYKMAWRDRQEGYRVGLSHLTLPYLLVWIGILLLFPAGTMLTLYGKGYPTTWTAANLPLRLMILHSVIHLGIILLAAISTSAVLSYLFRSRSVQVSSRCLAWKQLWGYNRIRWERVTEIVDTGEHICFCQNYPIAVVVPKLAFAGEEQADAFLGQAIHYWHHATGRTQPPPYVVGVWPPAPRPSNSAEPGDGREG